jgi:hypothetical protein
MSALDSFVDLKRQKFVQIKAVHAGEHGGHGMSKQLTDLFKLALSDWRVVSSYFIFHGESLLNFMGSKKMGESSRKDLTRFDDNWRDSPPFWSACQRSNTLIECALQRR